MRDHTGHPFRTPAGSPLEPVHRIAILHADRDEAGGAIVLANVGDRLRFWISRSRDGNLELAGAIHGGVSSRFDLAGPDQQLVATDYKVGLLFSALFGGLAARAELYHVSSHLGDEFILDTGAQPVSTSREGLDILLQGSPFPGLVLYGGPGILVRTSNDFDRLSLRGGADWESASPGRARLYASIDLFSWAEVGWAPSLASEVGLALGQRVRIGMLLQVGRSRTEQFFREPEILIGSSISYVR